MWVRFVCYGGAVSFGVWSGAHNVHDLGASLGWESVDGDGVGDGADGGGFVGS